MSAGTTEAPTPIMTDTPRKVFAALLGVVALAVLLQGLWAGIFLEHDGERNASSSWIDVHARGSEVALLISVVAAVWAVWKLRARKDLVIGSALLVVLLVAESYIGGLIRDSGKDTLTAVHVPLGMAIMAVVL